MQLPEYPAVDPSTEATEHHDSPQHDLPVETSQFDFWLGDWDLTWENGGAGTNTVSRILGGKVVEERFTAFATSPDEQPFQGLSLSVFVQSLGKWRQTWVDSAGNYMNFVGSYADEKLVLSMERTVNGIPHTYRMVFYNLAKHSLDWDWERSEDGGQSWELLWRIHYHRRAQ